MTTAGIGVRENGKFIKNIPLMVFLVVYITHWEKLAFGEQENLITVSLYILIRNNNSSNSNKS